ncbi:MAG TPA: protein kinase [Candidatus Saccharimonadaceae bacterium]|jgi:Tfp pilus assembly protein PilF|nr:protein kinase [Candidatus Saccharimonadaceae bacterium]
MDGTRVTHFQVGRMLGRGGMGEVYEARDLDLDRPVALKFIAPDLAADAENLTRFEREARSAAALNHPNIATLYSFEREGERRFIAMELVEGDSLRERIRRGPMPIPDALAVGRDVAAALALAHRRGIVHRDIKPENLMFGDEHRIKVMDFGLARAALASRLTMTGSTLGTAGYMSPELIRGSSGPPTDVFALGVVLYEMLAGRLPFDGDNPMTLMFTIANEPPRPLREARPDVPPAVEALVHRLLEKDPEKRPSAADAARELAALTGVAAPIARNETEELEVERRSAPETEMATLSTARTQAILSLPKPRWRFRVTWLQAVIALALFAFNFYWFALRPRALAQRHDVAVRLNNMGHDALQRNNWTGAADTLGLALSKDPRYAQAMVNLATAYRQMHRDDVADSLLRLALRFKSDDPTIVSSAEYNLGESDLRGGALPSAIQHLQTSLRVDSTSYPEPYIALGTALTRNGRPAEARVVVQRGLNHFARDARLLRTMGLVELDDKRPDQALIWLGAALQSEPALPIAHALRAEALARLGRMSEARADWRAYLGESAEPDERSKMLERVKGFGLGL